MCRRGKRSCDGHGCPRDMQGVGFISAESIFCFSLILDFPLRSANSQQLFIWCILSNIIFAMPARSLLDLPTEVRLLIFEHLYRLSEATLHIGQSDRCDLIQDGHSSRSLLRTNKLIREEAMPVFLERTTFVLSCSRCRGWDGNCYDLPNIRNVITDRRLADGIVKRFLYLCAAKHLRLNSLVIRNKLVVPSKSGSTLLVNVFIC